MSGICGISTHDLQVTGPLSFRATMGKEREWFLVDSLIYMPEDVSKLK